MRKIVVFISILLIIFFNIFTIRNKIIKEDLSYTEYIVELNDKYRDNREKILYEINKEILNSKNSKKNIGINLLARQYYFYLWIDNENLIKYADETEEYLIRYNMEDELLIFYSMMSSKYISSDKYSIGYRYIEKGEHIARRIYEENKSKEMLSTLVAIKYLKANVALNIGMEEKAEIIFKEAENLRKEGIRERIDVYTNIMLYYKNKKEYFLSEEYAIKSIKLIEDKYLGRGKVKFKRDVIRAKIILAESYIYTGKIDKSIEIANELSKNEDVFNNIYEDEKYLLYAQIYKYYGITQESIKYLEIAYDKIKNNESKADKIKVIELIIEQLELISDEEKLLYWYKIENDIFKSSHSTVDTQYLLSQIIDTDLENANYNIEILNIQRVEMIYWIVSLITIIIIIVIIIIIMKKRKKLLKENISILEKNITINQKYYENIKTNNENVRRIKHDIKNHIIVIKKLIYEKEYENVVNYIKSIEKEIDYNGVDITTNNKIIDAIISSKIELCKLDNINLDLDIKIPEKIEVEDFDICVIYGNLLDNAVEACRQVDEEINKYIKLKSLIKGEYLFINIKNSYSGNVIIKEGSIITNKINKKNHGLGIENIKKSIKKYNGDIKIDYTNQEFNVSIIMNATK
ncbi:MAG: sensor histidine kinase [Peptostreptococcaceae bacterium]